MIHANPESIFNIIVEVLIERNATQAEAAPDPEPDWIQWRGGECPIPDAKAGEYEIRFRFAIIEYRLLPAYHERKAREAEAITLTPDYLTRNEVLEMIEAAKREVLQKVADELKMEKCIANFLASKVK